MAVERCDAEGKLQPPALAPQQFLPNLSEPYKSTSSHGGLIPEATSRCIKLGFPAIIYINDRHDPLEITEPYSCAPAVVRCTEGE